jgi:hypothetical protein
MFTVESKGCCGPKVTNHYSIDLSKVGKKTATLSMEPASQLIHVEPYGNAVLGSRGTSRQHSVRRLASLPFLRRESGVMQLLKQLTDFDETLYRRYCFGCHPNAVHIDSNNMADA